MHNDYLSNSRELLVWILFTDYKLHEVISFKIKKK